MLRYWISYLVWTVCTWNKQPTDWVIPHDIFNYQSCSKSCIFMKRSFSNDVSIVKGGLWNLTYSFVFVPQYSRMILLVILLFDKIQMLIPYSIWMVVIFSCFIIGPSWEEESNRLSNYLVACSNKTLLCASMSSTEMMYSYVL